MTVVFFLLTFGLTWAVWSISAALGPAGTGVFGVRGPVFLIGVFAPAIVALGLTAYAEGRDGIARLLARVAHWQVSTPLYFFAVGYIAAAKLLAALAHRLVLGVWPAFGETPWPLLIGAIVISTWVQAGEELGWRGYALPRLAARLGLGGASLVLGAMWALWHLPLFFRPGSGSDGQSFPIYLLYVTSVSVAMAWLYWKSRASLFIVMLMHASVNNTIGIVPGALPYPVDVLSMRGSFVTWTTVSLSWAIAAWLLVQMRGADVSAIRESPASR